MTSRLYICVILLLMASALIAAPLKNTPVNLTQPDGTQLNIFASGDEFHNWLHDAEGYTIIRDDKSGYYTYAVQAEDRIEPGTLIAGRDLPHSRNLVPGINIRGEALKAKYESHDPSLRDYSNGRSPHTGQFNNLVIFIKFTGDPDFSSPISYYDNMFNAPGLSDNSMKNYFWHASYQQLIVDSFFYPAPDGTVIMTYVDPQPRNYYRPISASNPIGYNPDDDWERTIREHTMLMNCVNAVGTAIPADLDIDGDDDGNVDNVCFIVQGQPDGWAELLWPHRWVLYYTEAYIHGARVWDFNLQLESSLFSSGASVLAHEMFHSLGAPDLYRYEDNTITPIGAWDLMAGNSNPPQHMSVWMKYRYGQWIQEVPSITTSGSYSLSPVASSSTNNIYRVPSWRSTEAYILEYRKGSGLYDHNLPGSGLLVYRLDTREEGNASGPPDELYLYRPYGTDTTTNGIISLAHFSANQGRTMINETTSPNGFLGNNASGGLNLYNIGLIGDTITFDIKISDIQLTYPTGGETWFTGANKTITWKAKSSSGNVKIEYSTDNQQNWMVLVASTANDGSHTWNNIPFLDSSQCFIRLTLLSNNHSDTNTWPFIIISEVNPPELVYPAHQAINLPTNPVLRWNRAFGATAYQVQLSDDPLFESFLVNSLDHPDTSFACPNLMPFTQYFWRVASISDIGYSMFTGDYSFTTGQISVLPSVPSLLLPNNNATNVAQNPLLKWNASSLAESYEVQIATDSYFNTGHITYQDLTATEFRVPILSPNTTHFWRVRAINPAGYGNFSTIRRFTTGNFVSNDDEQNPALQNRLNQNYPNPFNPSTTISFELKNPSIPLSLRIFNTRGQLVKTLFSGIPQRSTLALTWDGTDEKGTSQASGIYYYRLESAEFSCNRKMLLMK
ncbi:MAG: M6 family metalloprotease domain-containing protein [Candidatus Cloacimonetes bacterium]|nr:M6 family metalloprotease domain-containing protein [Candidatus Cloacimonadota bacterium]